MALAVENTDVAADAIGRDLNCRTLVTARHAALVLGTWLGRRGLPVRHPFEIVLDSVDVLLAAGAGMPMLGIVMLPTGAVGLLGAILDLDGRSIGCVVVAIGLETDKVRAGRKTLDRGLTLGDGSIPTVGVCELPLVGAADTVDRTVREAMAGRDGRFETPGRLLVGRHDLNCQLALDRNVIGRGDAVFDLLGDHCTGAVARDVFIGGLRNRPGRPVIGAVLDLHVFGRVIDRHRRNMILTVIGSVIALRLNVLELRAVDGPVEERTVNVVFQAPDLAAIRTRVLL